MKRYYVTRQGDYVEHANGPYYFVSDVDPLLIEKDAEIARLISVIEYWKKEDALRYNS